MSAFGGKADIAIALRAVTRALCRGLVALSAPPRPRKVTASRIRDLTDWKPE